MQAWAGYLRATSDYSGFARGFLGSSEYLARPLSLHEHVAIVYATFLGRAPDAPGGAAWVDFLSGQFQPIYNGFIDSSEFQGRLALCQ